MDIRPLSPISCTAKIKISSDRLLCESDIKAITKAASAIGNDNDVITVSVGNLRPSKYKKAGKVYDFSMSYTIGNKQDSSMCVVHYPKFKPKDYILRRVGMLNNK